MAKLTDQEKQDRKNLLLIEITENIFGSEDDESKKSKLTRQLEDYCRFSDWIFRSSEYCLQISTTIIDSINAGSLVEIDIDYSYLDSIIPEEWKNV